MQWNMDFIINIPEYLAFYSNDGRQKPKIELGGQKFNCGI